MQASKTATEGSNAIALPEVLGILSECLHCLLLSVDLRLQRQHVLELRAAMLADIAEREIADIHAMNDKGTGDAQDARRVVRAELLVLREDGNTPALEETAESGLKQRRGLRRELHDLIPARLAPNADLDLITLAELRKGLGCLPVAVRELDKLQHMGGHGRFLSRPKIRLSPSNCNI